MSKPKILVFAPREEPPETIAALEGLGCELVFGNRDWQLPRRSDEDAVVEAARDAVALMGTSMRHTPITRRIMQASQRLRIVAKYTVGVDDIDTDAATELGIMVCHAPTESNCFGVAETTVTFMLALLKKIRERDTDVRNGKWRELPNFAYYVGSRQTDNFPGQTIGLVGFGRIGTRVAQLLAPWRNRIIAYDPYVPPAHFLTHGVRAVDYDTLLREADVVSFHVVLTKETRYMFGERELALMKPTAVVINTARGKVVDEKALAKAIAAGRIRGAAIDAFEEEPLPADFGVACARRQGAAVAPFGGLHRGRRASPGRGLGHPLGPHRARRQDPGQCVQQRSHSALEGALRRGEHFQLNDPAVGTQPLPPPGHGPSFAPMSPGPSAPIHIVGGGLAGCEAAWQIVGQGVPVVLHEMRPLRGTAAHKTAGLAELVCSNSFRSDDPEHNAVGLLHEEMRRLDSLVMRTADANQVPAGGALAVDRDGFSAAVTAALEAHPLVTLCREEIAGLPPAEWDSVIVATGPLTSTALADAIAQARGRAGAGLFRRHRPHRSSQLHRHVGRLAAVALRQGRPRRIGRRLHQLPAFARPLRGLHRCAHGGQQGELP